MDCVDNEIYAYNNNNNNNNNNNKHSLRSNIKGYGGKTHYTNSQNSDTTAISGRELYHLQFSLQAARPEIFGYTHVYAIRLVKHGAPGLRHKVKVKTKLSLCLTKYHAMNTYPVLN
jgi:hypothetical protein